LAFWPLTAFHSKTSLTVVEALSDANVRARFADLGQEIYPRDQQTPESVATSQNAEIEKWWPIHQGSEHQGGMTTPYYLHRVSVVRLGSFSTGTRPAAGPAMSAVPAKAEVKSGYLHSPSTGRSGLMVSPGA